MPEANDDEDLLQRAFDRVIAFGAPLVERLGAFDPGLNQTDLEGWVQPMPLRFELQVRDLALPCLDALEVGAMVLRRRYSGIGIVCTRFTQETLALLRWLTRPGDAIARQARAFGLMQRDLPRLKSMTERLAACERDAQVRAGFVERGRQLKAAIRDLPELARSHGVSQIVQAPRRGAMLDDMLGRSAGHVFFRATSEVAAHPGFMQFAAFADRDAGIVDVNLTGLQAQRAWWTTALGTAFADVARATADGLRWEGWVDETLAPISAQLDPVRKEVSRRIAEMP
jgi:hypothetical protein